MDTVKLTTAEPPLRFWSLQGLRPRRRAMARVHRAAAEGPADLRAFLARLRDLLTPA